MPVLQMKIGAQTRWLQVIKLSKDLGLQIWSFFLQIKGFSTTLQLPPK